MGGPQPQKSECQGCRKALRQALLNGAKPQDLKTENGHIQGCEALKTQEEYWPWAQPSSPAPPKTRPYHDPQPAPAPPTRPQPECSCTSDKPKKERIQQFKRVDHANAGEQRDYRKGVWFAVLIIAAGLVTPVFPPAGLVFAGAILALFIVR